MSRNIGHTCVVLVLALVIERSYGVSVRPDDKLESIKPSPVDVTQELPDGKSPVTFNQGLIDKPTDKHKKREDNDNDDDKSDVNFGEEGDRREKKTRTILGAFGDKDKFSQCCGTKFEVSGRPEFTTQQFTTRAADSQRYPDRYGNRPDDRYSWQSSSGRPGGSSLSGGSLYGSQGNPPDRYGSRPSYGSGVDTEYGRPPIRPSGSRPGYGYGDSGAYGSSGFETSRPGGVHFGGSRPPGGYGVYGTVGEQDEFPGDAADAPPPHPPANNIHTQKAVALKALAGVALIGAAAALAANPVLLPVGVLAGRRRRSLDNTLISNHLQFPYEFLRNHVPNIHEEATAEKFWNTPKCVARLTCEIQRHYITKMKDDETLIKNAPIIKQHLEKQLQQLIESEVFSEDYVRRSLRFLSNAAADVTPTDGNCSVFTCSLYVP